MNLSWIDLIIEGDNHPRRFDTEETLRAYLLKMERLSIEEIDLLVENGKIEPPITRRGYRIRQVG